MKSDKSPIPPTESLTVEFKSDRKRLPDDEMEKLLRSQKSVRAALDGAGVK